MCTVVCAGVARCCRRCGTTDSCGRDSGAAAGNTCLGRGSGEAGAAAERAVRLPVALLVADGAGPGVDLFRFCRAGPQSRLEGWPDVFGGLEHATDAWGQQPGLYGALESGYMAYALLGLRDAGVIVDAVARGVNSDAALRRELRLPRGRRYLWYGRRRSCGCLEIRLVRDCGRWQRRPARPAGLLRGAGWLQVG